LSDAFLLSAFVYKCHQCSCPGGYINKEAIQTSIYPFLLRYVCPIVLVENISQITCFGTRLSTSTDRKDMFWQAKNIIIALESPVLV